MQIVFLTKVCACKSLCSLVAILHGSCNTIIFFLSGIAAAAKVDYKKKYGGKYIMKYNTSSGGYGGQGTTSGYGSGEDSTSNPMLKYFDTEDGADITWAHAVNSKKKLDAALRDENVMMLEADVIMDPVNNIPIMAHPPDNTSDLTLKLFVNTVLDQSEDQKKGIKLDFKETQVLNASKEILQEALKGREKIPPIILNADILRGPNTDVNSTVDVDGEQFLNTFDSLKQAVLSPGWTTDYIGKNSTGYSRNNTDEMVSLLKQSAVDQHITFPVRASLIPLNPKQMHLLLGQFQKKGSITVWTKATDTYNPKDLGFLRLYKKQVFYDLPAAEIKIIKEAGDEGGFDWKKYVPGSAVPPAAKGYIP